LDQGGRLMYLGGNGFYWRIAFRDDCLTSAPMEQISGIA